MAIDINTSNEKSENKHNLATRGNVIETFKKYNEQIKAHYNDNATDKANNDSLQTSLSTIVKSLDKSNPISTEFNQNNPLEDLNTDKNGNTSFGDSGALRRLELLTKAVTPVDSDISNWSDDISANVVGSEKNDENDFVPVIARTKKFYRDGNVYSNNGEFNETFNILGMETSSQLYVLSERQIADMVVSTSRALIEDYTLRMIQLKNMIKNNNSKLISILNYIINSKSEYKDYFPVNVGYFEDSIKNKKYYQFVTLGSQTFDIDTSEFTNHQDKLYLTLKKNKETGEMDIGFSYNEVNSDEIITYCNVTLYDGKFIVRETDDVTDKGYELLLTNYPIFIIINSDIDLSIMEYEIYINGNPRKVVEQFGSNVFPSETRNFRYKVGLLSLEGQDLSIRIPYSKYKETDFKNATFRVDGEVLTEDKVIPLRNIISDININVDIEDSNTHSIVYYSGYENR